MGVPGSCASTKDGGRSSSTDTSKGELLLSLPICRKTKNSRDSIPKVQDLKTPILKSLAYDETPLQLPPLHHCSQCIPKKSSSRVTLICRDIGSKSHLQKRMWMCMQQIKRKKEKGFEQKYPRKLVLRRERMKMDNTERRDKTTTYVNKWTSGGKRSMSPPPMSISGLLEAREACLHHLCQ